MCNFGTNLGLTSRKYLIKIIFNIKIEISIPKILYVPNFNKSGAFLVLGQIWASGKYYIKIIFDIKIEISILEILDCQILINFKHF